MRRRSFDLLLQGLVGGGQFLDFPHRMQDGRVVTAAEALADFRERTRRHGFFARYIAICRGRTEWSRDAARSRQRRLRFDQVSVVVAALLVDPKRCHDALDARAALASRSMRIVRPRQIRMYWQKP